MAHVQAGKLELWRGEARSPAVSLETDPGTLAALLWHGGSESEALAAGSLRIEGSKREARRFLRMFPPAAPVTAPVA